MKCAATLAIAVLLASALFTVRSAAVQTLAKVDSLPESVMNAELQAFKGRSIHLADYKGRVVVLGMWASWCGPCVTMLPDLSKLNDEFADRSVLVIGLTKDENDDAAKMCEVARSYNVTFNLAWANKEIVGAILGKKELVPQVFVIRRDGNLQKRFTPFVPIEKYQLMLREEVNHALMLAGEKQ